MSAELVRVAKLYVESRCSSMSRFRYLRSLSIGGLSLSTYMLAIDRFAPGLKEMWLREGVAGLGRLLQHSHFLVAGAVLVFGYWWENRFKSEAKKKFMDVCHALSIGVALRGRALFPRIIFIEKLDYGIRMGLKFPPGLAYQILEQRAPAFEDAFNGTVGFEKRSDGVTVMTVQQGLPKGEVVDAEMLDRVFGERIGDK